MTEDGPTASATPTAFSHLLRRYRQSARLTQDELAERAALSPRGVRYLEHGTRLPYPDTVRRLIAALRLPEADAAGLIAAARGHRPDTNARPARLPPHPDLIGREVELAEALALVRAGRRLVNVTGPGGVGKTHFAIELAELAEPDFRHGVAWVPLAGVGRADDVAPAIMRALGGSEASRRTEPEAVLAILGERNVLLVLDNFEHVIDAAELVSRVVSGCPAVAVLVTSRASLRLTAEQEFWLDPLPLPRADEPPTVERIGASPAVQLFCERARSVNRHFILDASNVGDVAQLCSRLEGIPLALELAAARIRVLSPAELLAQFADRLDVLAGGPRDAPARHRSVRSTLDWSYDLLDGHARRLLRSLSVFAGGCTFSALRAVCPPMHGAAFNLIDAVDALQRQSLLHRVEPRGGEARYSLLETVREYAQEKLADAGEEDDLRARHATYFATVALDLAGRLEGPGQAAAVGRLEEEHDNLRVALHWHAQHDPEAGLHIAGELWMFWYMRHYLGEGRRYLAALLDATPSNPARPARAKALLGAGQLARAQGDFSSGRALMDASISAYTGAGDTTGAAFALFGAGFVAEMQEAYADARRYFHASLVLARETGNGYAAALTLHHLGLLALEFDGDPAIARGFLDESLEKFRSVGFPRHVALVLSTLGMTASRRGGTREARQLQAQALRLLVESGQRVDLHWVLQGFAEIAEADGDLEEFVRITATAERQRRDTGDAEWGLARRARERRLASARQALGDNAYEAAWRAGESRSADTTAARLLESAP